MRSRNGNSTLSFPIQAIALLLFSLALNASEYLISYRYLIKDAILYNQNLDIAKSMKPCSGTPYEPIIFQAENIQDIHEVISLNNEEFIDYIHKLGLSVKHHEETNNYQNSSTTILTLKTTCFKVDFNDNFVKISPLK